MNTRTDDKPSLDAFWTILRKKGGTVSMSAIGGIVFHIHGYRPYVYAKGIGMITESNREQP